MSFAVFADFLFQTLFQFQAADYLDCLYLVNSNNLWKLHRMGWGAGFPSASFVNLFPFQCFQTWGSGEEDSS